MSGPMGAGDPETESTSSAAFAFFSARARDKWGRFGSPALSLLADHHRTVEWPTKEESSATCELCEPRHP